LEALVIAAIVPAHNEEAWIGDCVRSLVAAAACPALHGERVVLVVVLDDCTDRTDDIAQAAGASTLAIRARNVGAARALGAQSAIAQGARWLAFTDADTVVAPTWISAQLQLCSDAVCGTVAVRDWGAYGERMRRHHDATYTDADGHHHIHGANLGVSSHAYLAAGGFPSLRSSEDVALVESLKRIGASLAWSAAPRVFTSARRTFRAPLGFGATLLRVELEAQGLAADADA
jgi:glycosyltransferase involved in cell wall biosynthesis